MNEKLMNFFMGYGYQTDAEILAYLHQGMLETMRDALKIVSDAYNMTHEDYEKWKAENPDRLTFEGWFLRGGK